MKPYAKYAAALVATIGVLVVVSAIFWPGSARQQSIDCVEKNSCLPSYRNTAVCESLVAGVPERELVFRLGQPVQAKGSSLYFEAGATERGPI
jgi:hypothetical protein